MERRGSEVHQQFVFGQVISVNQILDKYAPSYEFLGKGRTQAVLNKRSQEMS